MNTISIQNVSHLDGRETYISSCYSNGKVLTRKGDSIFLEENHPQKNQKWSIMMNDEGGVYLKNGEDCICYSGKGSDVYVSRPPYSEEGCLWNIGKSGELYQISPENEERYLWVAVDKLGVVSDGYLADSWRIADGIHPSAMPTLSVSSLPKKTYSLLFLAVVLTIALGIFFFLQKG
jgi:hypothetical protein